MALVQARGQLGRAAEVAERAEVDTRISRGLDIVEQLQRLGHERIDADRDLERAVAAGRVRDRDRGGVRAFSLRAHAFTSAGLGSLGRTSGIPVMCTRAIALQRATS